MGGVGGGGGGGSIVSTIINTVVNALNVSTSFIDSKQAAFNSPIGVKLSQNFPEEVNIFKIKDYIVGSQEEIDVPQKEQVTITFRADISDNKVVDVFDFNLMMVNWDKRVGDAKLKICSDRSIADINCDGKVDVFDFNLLMVKWNTKITNLIIKK